MQVSNIEENKTVWKIAKINVIIILILIFPFKTMADVIFQNNVNCNVLINGVISKGDYNKIFDNTSIRSVCLDSIGGSYGEAIKISEIIMDRSIQTNIEADARCFSACAIIFMSGSEAVEGIYLSNRRMHFTSILGFHAPYVIPKSGNNYSDIEFRAAFTEGMRAVTKLVDLGRGISDQGFIPSDILIEILSKGPNEFYYVDDLIKAKKLNIDIYGLNKIEKIDQGVLCNACVYKNEGRIANNLCTENIEKKKIKDTTYYRYYGVGGEGVYYCVVKRDAVGKIYVKEIADEGEPINKGRFEEVSNQVLYGAEKILGPYSRR